uniref:Metalloendopeptidase n=1 Tax=Strongyloides papillosus TaxID=174720 RepID=A0A0N5C6Z3_STREA
MGLKVRNETDEIDTEIVIETPMENLDLYEGDTILTEKQVDEMVDELVKQADEKKIDVSNIEDKSRKKRGKRSIYSSKNNMWTFPIPYYVETGVDATLVTTALNFIESETCVRFTKSATPITGKPGLRRIYTDAPQEISIGSGCGQKGILQHETAHALGVYHEQSRPDRYLYVSIKTENIIAGKESNFAGSIPGFAFSKNGNQTIVALDRKFDKTMGQRNMLSFNDVKLINYKYCNSTCPSTSISCRNGGYENPNSCGVCRCPLGFYGTNCQNYVGSKSTLCGNQFLTANTTLQTLNVTGAIECYYYISTPMYQVRLNVISTNLVNNDPCYTGKGLEIKYQNDRSALIHIK